MARNVSVERFKALTKELQAEVRAASIAELNKQADDLVAAIQNVVAVDEGDLKASVRKLSGKKPSVVRVAAGGESTRRTNGAGKPYDHARAIEFGTVNMPAQPFFFSTYRLRKKKMISGMKRKLTAGIKSRWKSLGNG